jgi:hypothetical protein
MSSDMEGDAEASEWNMTSVVGLLGRPLSCSDWPLQKDGEQSHIVIATIAMCFKTLFIK